MRLASLLFDLDGTLTDPRVGIVRCIQHALGPLARPCAPGDALAACIGPPLRRTFARLLRTSEPDAIERAMALYRERFAEVGLFVATSKPAVFARPNSWRTCSGPSGSIDAVP